MPSRIICDTMIWYYLGNGQLDKAKYKNENLTLTFISILEAGTSFNLLHITDKVRNAIQSMMVDSKDILYEPPLIYLAQLANPDFKYEPMQDHQQLFEGTKRIAKGHDIEEDKKADFEKWLETEELPLIKFSDFTNEKLLLIRSKITDRASHLASDTTEGNRKLISSWVSTATNAKYDLSKLDWSKIELFEKTMRSFFKELELSKSNMKFQPNDFLDMLNLIYVQPQDKYFTMEKRWILRIKNAGMDKYLAV